MCCSSLRTGARCASRSLATSPRPTASVFKNAIYGGSKLLYAQVLKEDRDIALVSSDYRLMNFNTSLLKTKTTTNTQGVQAFTARGPRSPP